MPDDLREKISQLLAAGAPNWLRPAYIITTLANYDAEDVSRAIDSMVDELIIEKKIVWRNYGPSGGEAFLRPKARR